jgi:hypothetical protein
MYYFSTGIISSDSKLGVICSHCWRAGNSGYWGAVLRTTRVRLHGWRLKVAISLVCWKLFRVFPLLVSPGVRQHVCSMDLCAQAAHQALLWGTISSSSLKWALIVRIVDFVWIAHCLFRFLPMCCLCLQAPHEHSALLLVLLCGDLGPCHFSLCAGQGFELGLEWGTALKFLVWNVGRSY